MEQQVLIEDLTIWGEGVGRENGLAIFIEGALPGEKVSLDGFVKKGSYGKARVKELLTLSPYRVNPICPVFGKCGGCQIMHLAYEEQLKIKQKRVHDSFERIGKLKEFTVAPCEPSPDPLYYRNKIQLPVENGQVGLYAKRSHDIVPIKKCYIQNEAGNVLLQQMEFPSELRHILIRTNRKGESLVVLVTREEPTEAIKKLAKKIKAKGVLHGLNARDDNVLASDAYTLLAGVGRLEEEILGIKVEISPASFFQVNVKQAEKLYQKAFERSELKAGERALDAYSGIGVFSIYLAAQGIEVAGIEVVAPAVEDAQENALVNGVNIDFRLGMVEECIHEIAPCDVIFLNPPRKGCDEIVLQAILAHDPKKIIYTSCDPATLARDLQLLQKGGYTKIEAYPFDMFPQTMHVETVAVISKKE